MWHEARKQEKKIKGMLVDYKKRAERRREYYEKIKLDPTQFLQLHGRNCKIHIDPAISYAAEAPGSLMPWRADKESIIDRFDVRAHLDEMPVVSKAVHPKPTPEDEWEERQANYERYRILVQNVFLGIKEEKFLHQIRMEELYGPISNKSIEEEKKLLAPKKAAIGFTYTDGNSTPAFEISSEKGKEGSGDESESDIDLDMTVDVLSLTNTQQRDLNKAGVEYGLKTNDFMELISRDLQEAEALRLAKEHEDEKAMFSGRKSRKERRALKKKHLDKKLSPPSYAARASPNYAPYRESSSRSRSRSTSLPTCQIKFITSFGGETDGEEKDGSVIVMPRAQMCTKEKKDKRSSLSKHIAHKHRHSSSRSRSASSSSSDYLRRKVYRKKKDFRSHSKSPKSSSFRSKKQEHRTRRSKSYSSSDSETFEKYTRGVYKRKSQSRSNSHPSMKSLKNSSTSKGSCETTKKNGNSSPKSFPSPPRKRYYGRRGKDSETNSESGVDDGDDSNPGSCCATNSTLTMCKTTNVPAMMLGSGSSANKQAKATPQERLRRKMQALLKKQYKEDKRIQREKQEKAEQERQDREEELRELAIKMRRRERERRHRLHGDQSPSDSSNSESAFSHSRSRSRGPSVGSASPTRNRSRSDSKSKRSRSTSKTRKNNSRSSSTSRQRKSRSLSRTRKRRSLSPRSRSKKSRSPQRGTRSGSKSKQKRSRSSSLTYYSRNTRYRKSLSRDRSQSSSRSSHSHTHSRSRSPHRHISSTSKKYEGKRDEFFRSRKSRSRSPGFSNRYERFPIALHNSEIEGSSRSYDIRKYASNEGREDRLKRMRREYLSTSDRSDDEGSGSGRGIRLVDY